MRLRQSTTRKKRRNDKDKSDFVFTIVFLDDKYNISIHISNDQPFGLRRYDLM